MTPEAFDDGDPACPALRVVGEDHAAENAALDKLVAELRAADGPRLDWSRVESKILSKIDAETAAKRARVVTRPPSGISRAFAFAAAAAVMAIGGASLSRSGGAEVAATPRHAFDVANAAVDARGVHELMSLHEGDVLEASNDPLRFGHEGVLEWTLSPGSRAVVLSMGHAGVGHTLSLERGTVHGEVVPRAASEGLVEAFAIEVDGTRVAVHGTSFTVTRLTDGTLLVDVEHGSIAVGPAGHQGETSGHLLIGPARAVFSGHGGVEAHFVPRLGEPNGGIAAASSPSSSSDSSAAPLVANVSPASREARDNVPTSPPRTRSTTPLRATEPEEPTAAPPVSEPASVVVEPHYLTQSAVEAGINRCFKSVYGDPDLKAAFSFDSTFTVTPNTDGSFKKAFSPPPRPEVSVCVGELFVEQFAPGSSGFSLHVHYGR